MAILYRQWVDGFTAEVVDTNCSVSVGANNALTCYQQQAQTQDNARKTIASSHSNAYIKGKFRFKVTGTTTYGSECFFFVLNTSAISFKTTSTGTVTCNLGRMAADGYATLSVTNILGGAITLDHEYLIEFIQDCNVGSAGFYEIKVDGSVAATGTPTSNTTDTGTSLSIGWQDAFNGEGTTLANTIVISEAVVANADDTLPSPSTGKTLYPDADLDAGDWTTTPLFSKVDEVTAGGDVISSTAS